MIKLKTTNTKLDEIALSLNKKQLFSDDNNAYIYRVVFRPDIINNIIRFDDINLLKVYNNKINDDIKYKVALNTSYTSGGTFISQKESIVDHNGDQYKYVFNNINDKMFTITKSCVEEDCNEYNDSNLDIYYDSDKSIFVVNSKKKIHRSSGPNKYIDETITLVEEDNSFAFEDPSKYYTLFIVFNNNFAIDTVKVFNREINLEECFYDLISDFDTGRDDIVFSTVGKKVDMKRIETTEFSNSNISIRSNKDLVYEKYNGLENFMEIDNIEFPDGTYIFKDTEDDIRVDDPDYYFPMVMYGNTIGRYTQVYLNPGNDDYYNDADIRRVLLDTTFGIYISSNIKNINNAISATINNIITNDLGGYLGVTLSNDNGYDKHHLEAIRDMYEKFYSAVWNPVYNYIDDLFLCGSIRYYEDTFESDCEDTKVYDFSNLNKIDHRSIKIKKLIYTDKIFKNEDESAGIDILNLIIEYNSNDNVYVYNITAMYSNKNNTIMNININCTVNKKDSFAINLNQIDKCNLLCYSYIDNSNDIAEEVPISARMLKYTESGLSKTFIYDIYPSGDSYSDIFDKNDYPVYSAFSAGIRIK